MSDLDAPTLTVLFENIGFSTKNIKSYELDSAFMTSTDGFRFTVVRPSGKLLTEPLELAPVQLFINDNLQLVGRIDKTIRGDEGIAIKCEGRDYIAEMVECNIDPAFKITDDEPIENIVLRAAAATGIQAVEVNIDSWRDVRTGGIQSKGKNAPGASVAKVKAKDFKPNPGQGIYDYINRLLLRHSATMQPVGDRTRVALASPNYIQDPSFNIVRNFDNPAGQSNNVLSAVAVRDYSHFPTVILGSGKIADVVTSEVIETDSGNEDEDAGGGRVAPSAVSGAQEAAGSHALDTDITATVVALIPESVKPITARLKNNKIKRPATSLYRLYYLKDEESKTQGQLDRVLIRAAAEKMKDSLRYEVTLRGHVDPKTNKVYAVDTMVDVNDEICGLNERLWVEHRTFSYDSSTGPITKLTLWRPGSFPVAGLGDQPIKFSAPIKTSEVITTD